MPTATARKTNGSWRKVIWSSNILILSYVMSAATARKTKLLRDRVVC